MNLSNKSFPVSAQGVDPARGQRLHLPPSARRSLGGELWPALCNSASPPPVPLSPDSVSSRAFNQSLPVRASECWSPPSPGRAQQVLHPGVPGGAGCALPWAAIARDCNFLPSLGLASSSGSLTPHTQSLCPPEWSAATKAGVRWKEQDGGPLSLKLFPPPPFSELGRDWGIVGQGHRRVGFY